jgi:hypothetical protein
MSSAGNAEVRRRGVEWRMKQTPDSAEFRDQKPECRMPGVAEQRASQKAKAKGQKPRLQTDNSETRMQKRQGKGARG